MRKNAEKSPIVGACPFRSVVARFGNKWSFLVLYVLNENGATRFSELCNLIPDVSARVLSSTLKILEADALISRKVYPVVPPKVEYKLTEIGISLIPIIMELAEWAQENMEAIISHRQKYERKHLEG